MPATAKPETFWEGLGKDGYANLYSSSEVESNTYDTIGSVAVEMGTALGLGKNSRILDLGCGDGRLANTIFASSFGHIEGIDLSQSAIDRAKTMQAKANMNFTAADITTLNYDTLGHFDGVFLFGILHHVKSATPDILRKLSLITDKLIVMEPNGNNVLRKILEQTRSYKDMGEDSFRTREFEDILARSAFRKREWRRLNLFPNFTPPAIFRMLKPIEPIIEKNSFLNALCTVNMWSATRDKEHT